MSRSKFILLSAFLILMIGCSDYKAYHQFYSIDQGRWSKTDSLIYKVQNIPEDATLQFEVRFTAEYPYNDLYVGIKENISDSTSFKIDTLRISLAHTDGRSKGSTLGKLYQTATGYKTIKRIQKAKSNEIFVYHLMSDSTLIGIEDVGIRINRVNDVPDLHPSEERQTTE